MDILPNPLQSLLAPIEFEFPFRQILLYFYFRITCLILFDILQTCNVVSQVKLPMLAESVHEIADSKQNLSSFKWALHSTRVVTKKKIPDNLNSFPHSNIEVTLEILYSKLHLNLKKII